MSVKFETSGLRGLSIDLVGRIAAVYATAFGRYIVKANHATRGAIVLVGRDLRDSSHSITATCIGALLREGFVRTDCGLVPTLALALHANSSNAAWPNSTALTRRLTSTTSRRLPPSLLGTIDETPAAATSHFVQCTKHFFSRNISVLPENVCQHSTLARDLFVDVLKHYGAQVISFGRSYTFVAVDTEAVSIETVKLLKSVASAAYPRCHCVCGRRRQQAAVNRRNRQSAPRRLARADYCSGPRS